MRSLRIRFFVFLTVVLGVTASVIAGDFFIKDGDRVVFLGDSITEQRLYTTYIEAYALEIPRGCGSGRIPRRNNYLPRTRAPSRKWSRTPSDAG